MPGLSVGLTSSPGNLNKPTLGGAPPRFAAGPGGTSFQYNPGGLMGGVGGVGGNVPGGTQEGWFPVTKPRTQQDQINEEMQLANLRRMNLENDQLATWGGVGVPRTGTSSSSSSGTGTAPSVTQLKTATELLQPGKEPPLVSPTVPGTQIAAPKPGDNTAATNAAYARAKDKIALEGSAAGKAMQGAMTARGISGSGIEAKGAKDITRASLAGLGQVARDQAMSDVEREDAFAKLGYTGGIQQRGQDIQAILAKYAADLTQRGQNINAQYNPLGYIGPLTALSMAGGSLS